MSSLSPRKLLSDDAEALLLNLFSGQPCLLGCEILFLRYKLEKGLRAVYLTDGDAMYQDMNVQNLTEIDNMGIFQALESANNLHVARALV